MKTNYSLLTLIALTMTVSACSSSPKHNSTSEQLTLEDILTDRAIAQVTAGGQMLVQLVENSTSVAEKNAVMNLIKKTAQEQGLSASKITSKSLATAFEKGQSAQIIAALSKSNPQLFNSAQNKALSEQANAVLSANYSAAEKSSLATGSTALSKTDAATVKNLYNGFNKNKDYVRAYITVSNNTGFPIWTPETCTQFKKLDAEASANLLKIGQANADVSYSVKNQGLTGQKASNCMIRRGSVATANVFTQTLSVPQSEVVSVMKTGAEQCKLFPTSYPSAVQGIMAANGGNLPRDAAAVSCN